MNDTENIIDNIENLIDDVFNAIKCDLEQFLLAEDMLNQFTDSFQPYFIKSINTKDVEKALSSFISVNTYALNNISDVMSSLGEVATEFIPFTTNPNIRTFKAWYKSLEEQIGTIPIFNAALLYIALELGIFPNNIPLPLTTSSNDYNNRTYIVRHFVKKMLNRSILYLSEKGYLNKMLNEGYLKIMDAEAELKNLGYRIDEYFDTRVIDSRLLEVLPSLSEVNKYDILETFENAVYRFSDKLNDNITLLTLKDLAKIPADEFLSACKIIFSVLNNDRSSIRTQYLRNGICEAFYIFIIADYKKAVIKNDVLEYLC
jgi:hypothetical protein